MKIPEKAPDVDRILNTLCEMTTKCNCVADPKICAECVFCGEKSKQKAIERLEIFLAHLKMKS